MSLQESLTQLEQAQLVEGLPDDGAGLGPVYQFRHALVQESAYQSLLLRRRREFHLRVARVYERVYAGRLEEYAPILAQHFEKGEARDKACRYHSIAGNAAFRLSAYTEALDNYDRALAADTAALEPGELKQLYLNRGRAFELTQRFDFALKNYRRMVAEGEAAGDDGMKLAALLALGVVQTTSTPVHDPAEGERLAVEALALSERLGDLAGQARALWVLLLQGWPKGWGADIVAYGERSLALARELGLREQTALTLGDLALAYGSLGQLDRYIAALEETIGLWWELKNPVMVANTMNTIAMAYLLKGEYGKGIAAGKNSYELSKPIGNLWSQLSGALQAGIYGWEKARFGEAVAWLQESVALSEQGGLPFQEAICRAFLGLTFSWLGDRKGALEQAEKAAPGTEWAPGDIKGWIQSVLALIYLESGELAKAEYLLSEYLPKANPRNLATPAAVFAFYARCRLLESQGDAPGAMEGWRQLQITQEETGVLFMTADAHLHQGRLLFARGEGQAALEHLDAAKKAAQSLGVRRLLWQILALEARLAKARGDLAIAGERRQQAVNELAAILDSIYPAELQGSFKSQDQVRVLLNE